MTVLTREPRNPFYRSVLAQPALARVAAVALILVALWVAVVWAVSLP